VRDIQLFLRLLAERVYTARLSTTGALRDAGDFHAWLVECSDIAGRSTTMQDFFDMLS
jgi:hypothetical protein